MVMEHDADLRGLWRGQSAVETEVVVSDWIDVTQEQIDHFALSPAATSAVPFR
jgi:hypothetical protein